MQKSPPCDVTIEFSTQSPLTDEQVALLKAIKAVLRESGRGTAKCSLRTYQLEAKHPPFGVNGKKK
jgi:hypothetical protein